MTERHTLPLTGCHPAPLAHYLKALGILAAVEAQADPDATCWWENDTFHLRTRLSRQDLRAFFLSRWQPTAVLAPWNGGSGFNPKDNKEALLAIEGSTTDRLQPYREAIAASRRARDKVGVTSITDEKTLKEALIITCRNLWPDHALRWLNAAVVLTGENPAYPPLLGTGGNDGRLDFTNNYMQQLCRVVDPTTGEPTVASAAFLHNALEGGITDGLRDDAMGQFAPSGTGGNNMAETRGKSLVNPWDFLLMLEGACLWTASIGRRLESNTQASATFPFTVRSSPVGYGSATRSDRDAARAEIWLPLWSRPTPGRELRALLREGRATLGRRTANSGLDVVRAISALGVDRGLAAFQRIGFLERNGLAYLAVTLDRVPVRRNTAGDLLTEMDDWMTRVLRLGNDRLASARIKGAARALESAAYAVARDGSRRAVTEMLLAVDAAQTAISRTWQSADEQNRGRLPKPVVLRDLRWLTLLEDTNTPEVRLAISLASRLTWLGEGTSFGLLQLLEPIRRDSHGRLWWDKDAPKRDLISEHASLEELLAHALLRGTLLYRRKDHASWPEHATEGLGALPQDLAAFCERRVDDRKILVITRALLRLDWTQKNLQRTAASLLDQARRAEPEATPTGLWSLLKLTWAGLPVPSQDAAVGKVRVPMATPVLTHGLHGSDRAITTAVRRLRGSGLAVAFDHVGSEGDSVRRTTLSLALPIDSHAMPWLRLALAFSRP